MALQDIQPLSAYTYESVLPRLGYQYRVDDETGRGAYYNVSPEEGTGRVRFEEGAPTDPNLQYAPQRLYEQDLRQQGFVPTSPGDLYYYAQYGQYGAGQGFGGNVRAYLDYVYGPGTTVIQDPTHGYLIKPADPARALPGSGTPVALPNRSGSFGDFLKEGAATIAPVAAMAFAGPLAQALGTVLGPTGGQIAASAIIGGTQAELQGGDFAEGAIKAGATAGINAGVSQTGISTALKGVLTEAGLPANLSDTISKGIEKAGGVAAAAAATGGNVERAILNTAINYASRTGEAAIKDIREAAISRTQELEDAGMLDPGTTQQISQLPDSYWTAQAGLDTGTVTDVPRDRLIIGREGEAGAGGVGGDDEAERIAREQEAAYREAVTATTQATEDAELLKSEFPQPEIAPFTETTESPLVDEGVDFENELPIPEPVSPRTPYSPDSQFLRDQQRREGAYGTGGFKGIDEGFRVTGGTGGVGGVGGVGGEAGVGGVGYGVGSDIPVLPTVYVEDTRLPPDVPELGRPPEGYPMPVPEPPPEAEKPLAEPEPEEEYGLPGIRIPSDYGGYTTPSERATTRATPTSTAYLARGAVGSPEITGSPVFGTEKGKRKKVWNIESLREALGV